MSINLNIIYNLTQYIRDELPGEQIFADERFPIAGVVPERNVLIRESGGGEVPVMENTTYQIICRDVDNVGAKSLANSVYEKLQSTAKIGGRFGLILPATTVGVVAIDQVQIAKIEAIQRPESLGKDGNGLSEFSMNFQLFL